MRLDLLIAFRLLLGASMPAETDAKATIAPDYSVLSDDEAKMQKQRDVEQKRIFSGRPLGLGQAPPSLLAALRNKQKHPAAATVRWHEMFRTRINKATIGQ